MCAVSLLRCLCGKKRSVWQKCILFVLYLEMWNWYIFTHFRLSNLIQDTKWINKSKIQLRLHIHIHYTYPSIGTTHEGNVCKREPIKNEFHDILRSTTLTYCSICKAFAKTKLWKSFTRLKKKNTSTTTHTNPTHILSFASLSPNRFCFLFHIHIHIWSKRTNFERNFLTYRRYTIENNYYFCNGLRSVGCTMTSFQM